MVSESWKIDERSKEIEILHLSKFIPAQYNSIYKTSRFNRAKKTGRVACTMNASVTCQFCEIKILIQSQTKTSLERSRVEHGRCQKLKAADVA